MATIRCIEVAASAQFVAERIFAIVAETSELRSLLRCSSCCERSGHPFGKSSGEGALNSECSSYHKMIDALWQLHPGMTRSFIFLCHSKRSGLLTKENDEGEAALLIRVEGRSSTVGRQLMLSFIAWIRGSLLQSAWGRCQWRSSRKQHHYSDSEFFFFFFFFFILGTKISIT